MEHSFAGDFTDTLFPAGGSFTALLTAEDEDNDVFFDELLYQKPIFVPSIFPPSETLESLIPASVLSGESSDGYLRIPSTIPSHKRALEEFPFPSLQSLDTFPPTTVMPTQKLPRVDVHPPISTPPPLESILNGFSLSDFVSALMATPEIDSGAHQVSSQKSDKGKRRKMSTEIAKDRRQKISEKIRYLGKLLPSSDDHRKKKDTASLLEEAHAYIKFLEAQVKALSSMPARSAYDGVAKPQFSTGAGLLRSLSRQQLLQVVVNSPAAQSVLSSEKCCVVSAEQVAILWKVLNERLMSAAGF